MESIKCPYWYRKRIQRTRKHWCGQLEERHTADERSHCIAVRLIEPASVNPVPDLVFEEAARYQLSR